MKKCGYKEKCFVPNPYWGHFESEMCNFLSEENGKSICNKDYKQVDIYNKKDIKDIN